MRSIRLPLPSLGFFSTLLLVVRARGNITAYWVSGKARDSRHVGHPAARRSFKVMSHYRAVNAHSVDGRGETYRERAGSRDVFTSRPLMLSLRKPSSPAVTTKNRLTKSACATPSSPPELWQRLEPKQYSYSVRLLATPTMGKRSFLTAFRTRRCVS